MGNGPLVKSTAPTVVTVFNVLKALATAALLFGVPLFFKAVNPASNNDMVAPICWFHCLPAVFS